MTDKKKLKRRVRERMARTGESYTRALYAVQNGLSEPRSLTDAEVVEEYGLAVLGVDAVVVEEPA